MISQTPLKLFIDICCVLLDVTFMNYLFEEQYEYAPLNLHIKGIVHPKNENCHIFTLMSFQNRMTFFLPNTNSDLRNIYADGSIK